MVRIVVKHSADMITRYKGFMGLGFRKMSYKAVRSLLLGLSFFQEVAISTSACNTIIEHIKLFRKSRAKAS
jgi:hypothetical protein